MSFSTSTETYMQMQVFMEKLGLRNGTTSGRIIVNGANETGRDIFSLYVKTDRLATQKGLMNLTYDNKNGNHFVAFNIHQYFHSFWARPVTDKKNQLAP